MAGQKDYKTQIIGVPHGNNYTIAQVGCLLYAEREILGRFGHNIDLLTLNQYFIDHNLYVDAYPKDDILDDLAYDTLTKVEGSNVAVVAQGGGAPSSNNSIVKFIYTSPNTGKKTTHFCAVIDAAAGLILDSWDGVVKHWSIYGGPVEFASYDYAVKAAAQVDPHPDAPGPNRYEAIGTREFTVKLAPTTVWDLGFTNWPDARIAEQRLQGSRFTAVGVYHHPLGGTYYMDAESFGDAANTGHPDSNKGINSADLADYIPPAPPPAAPIKNFVLEVLPEAVEYITIGSAHVWNYDTNDWTKIDQSSTETIPAGTHLMIAAIAHNTTLLPDGADYLIREQDFDAATGTVKDTLGINHADMSLYVAPAPVVEAAASAAPVDINEPAPAPTFETIERAGGFTKAVGWFRATDDAPVYGKEGEALHKGQLFHRAATFTVDGQKYAISFRSVENRTLYGVNNDVLTATQAPQPANPAITVAQAANDDDNLFNELFKDMQREGEELLGKAKTVAAAGRASHSIRSVGGIFHKKKKG